jgi:hypothetical protein
VKNRKNIFDFGLDNGGKMGYNKRKSTQKATKEQEEKEI